MEEPAPKPTEAQVVDRPPPRPRWVKLLALGALVVVLLLVVAMHLAGGAHGPGMHG